MKKLILAALLVSASAAAAETPIVSYLCPLSDGSQVVVKMYGNDTMDIFEQGTEPGPRKVIVIGSETEKDIVLHAFDRSTHQLDATLALVNGQATLFYGEADGDCNLTQHRGRK